MSQSRKGRKISEETCKKLRGQKRSEEVRKKMSESKLGDNNSQSKPIEINGIYYGCIKEAAEKLGIKIHVLKYAIWRFRHTRTLPKSLQHLKIKLLSKEEQ